MKQKTFEQFMEANPYKETRSFTKEDWEISMYEKWKDESKEVKEGGELFTGGDWELRGNKIFVKGTYNSIAQIHIQKAWDSMANPIEDFESKANADLLVQSKNMYYALKRCRDWFYLNAKDLKIPLEGVGAPACFEEILTAIEKATPKK